MVALGLRTGDSGQMPDLDLTKADAGFREELRDWLAENLVGDFKHLGPVGGPTEDDHWDLRLAWERRLAAGRWLNVTWPVEYGGRGGTPTQELIFHVEHADAGAPYWVGVQGRDLLGPTLLEYGTESQKKRFLPAIARCDEMWGQGFSEPDAGSDLAALQTRATLDGREWVISGQKTWTTFGSHADWLYLLCRTNPDRPRHKGISMLLVTAHQPGVEIRAITNIAGGQEFCEIFLDEARTPIDHVVGQVDGGWSVVMGTLGNERAGSTVLPFQANFQREVRRLLRRVAADGRSGDPVLRQRLAQAWSGLRIMQLNNDRMLNAVLQGCHPGAESSISKLHWSRWHRDFGELMVDALGAASLAPDEEAEAMARSFLNSRAETIYGGSAEIQRNIIAERVLGLPR